MARRQRTSPIEDVITLASMMPWYINIILALIAFGILHGMATAPTPKITNPGQMNVAINFGLSKVFATFGQFVLPFIFGMAAVISLIKKSKAKRDQQTFVESPRSQQTATYNPPPPPTFSQRTEPSPYPEKPEPIIEDEFDELTNKTPERLTPELLREIEWKSFETLCSELLNTLGYVAIETDHGPDEGIDIIVTRNNETKPFGIVQCKGWNTRQVGVKEIRELLGIMTKKNLKQAMFMTKSTYTKDAIDFSKNTKVTLVTGEMLINKINTLPDYKRIKILNVVLSGDYKTPTCPSCGIKMIKRTAAKGPNKGNEFWGCKNYTSYQKCKKRYDIKTGKSF